MVPNTTTTCHGLEYFCFMGDGLWNARDSKLVDHGKKKIGRLGLVEPADVRDGSVVRMEKSNLVYFPGYQDDTPIIRCGFSRFANFQLIGHNGMHKYIDQYHSMMTSLLAARNLSGSHFDLWSVNTDAEYHEQATEMHEGSGRLVPTVIKLARVVYEEG